MAKELEAYMKEVGVDGDGDPRAARGDEESEDDLGEDEDGDELQNQNMNEDEDLVDMGEDLTRTKSFEIQSSSGDGAAFDTSALKDALGNDVESSTIGVNNKT
jgi:RIO kinase 2